MNSINDFRPVTGLIPDEQSFQQATAQPGSGSPLYQAAAPQFLQALEAAVETAVLQDIAGTQQSSGFSSPQSLNLMDLPGLPLGPGSPPPPTMIPNADKMPFLTQGNTNDCGPTSLAMILNYYGIPDTRQDIDEAIHRGDNSVGGTPEDEMQYAEDRGLEAREYNNGTWDEVKSMLDQGYPVMASVDGPNMPESGGDPGDTLPGGRHQIVIVGHETGADGKEYVLFHDPNHSKLEKLSVDDFEKAWSKEDFGVKNFFMVFAPKGTDLPASRMDGAQGAMGTLNGAANLCNAFDRLFHPDNFGDWVHGIPEFVGGLVQTVGCGFGALLQLGAEKLKGLCDGVPVLRNFVDPFADLVSGFGGCVADVFNGWGKAFNDVGGAFDDLCHGRIADAAGDVGQAAVDVGKGVVNAVSDGVSAVGSAISDVFSGW